jgi:hypothetical protein
VTEKPANPQSVDERAAPRRLKGWPLVLAVLFLCGFAVRLYKITDAPLDYHPTRQYISANIVRGMYVPHLDTAPDWRRTVARINGEAEMHLEPRYMETIAAGLYRLTGGERLWLARGLGALLWVVGAMLLLPLSRRFLDERWSVVVLLLYLFFPFGIIGSQVFQPEPLMITAMIAALLLIYRSFEHPSWRRVMAAAVVSSFAVSAKPVCIFFIVFSFVALAFVKKSILGSLREPKYWVFGVVAVCPSLVYYMHQMLGATDLGGQSDLSFRPELILAGRFWWGWVDRLGRVVGLCPFAIGLAGALACRKREGRYFLGSLYVAYAVYGFVFTYHIHTHDYYSLPAIPVVALTAPLGLMAAARLLSICWQRNNLRKVLVALSATAVVCLTLGAGGALVAKGPRKTCAFALKYGGRLVGLHRKFVLFADPRRSRKLSEIVGTMEKLGEALGHSTRVACLTEDYGKSVLYHAQISGPRLRPFASPENLLEQCMAAAPNVDYIVVRLYDSPSAQGKLREELLVHYPIAFEAGDCIAFDVRDEKAAM